MGLGRIQSVERLLGSRDSAARRYTEERSRAASWFGTGAITVVIWSVSYLIRQPGVATLNEPFSPLGNLALEGMVLALAWLGLLVTICLAILTGAAVVDDPTQ
jgi:hypothetical protein